MEWKALSLEIKPVIDQALKKNPISLSDYTFTNLWIWNNHRQYEIAFLDNFLCIKFKDAGHLFFLYPIGEGSRKELIKKLMNTETTFRMRAVPEEALAELKELPLHIEAETEHFDYIYSYADLLYLHGDHFQSKRNFIHQFEKNYHYEYQQITPELIPLVIEAEKKWYSEHPNPSEGLRVEHECVLSALNDFIHLNVYGGALIVDQKVVAYSLAEYLTKEMLVIHVEKALKEFKGGYAMINQQMLMHLRMVAFINREEDLGLDNLTKVKQSYHPIRLAKKYLLSLTEN